MELKLSVYSFGLFLTALAEARDISIHLNPLEKHFTQIEEIDFAESKPLLEPLMHVVCMVWSRSRYYCQSSKITVLLRQICNLLIHQVLKLSFIHRFGQFKYMHVIDSFL